MRYLPNREPMRGSDDDPATGDAGRAGAGGAAVFAGDIGGNTNGGVDRGRGRGRIDAGGAVRNWPTVRTDVPT